LDITNNYMKKKFTILMLFVSTFSIAQISNTELLQYLNKLGFKNLKTNDFIVNSSSTDKKTGITHIYFKQAINGNEVFNTQSSIHVDKNKNILSKNLAINNISVASNNQVLNGNAVLTIALKEASIVKKVLNKVEMTNDFNFKIIDKNVSSEEIVGKKIFYVKNGQLLNAHQVEIYNDETSEWLNIIIDAENGSIIEKINYTTKCNIDDIKINNENKPYFFHFDDENKLGKTGNKGTYNVFPIPFESPSFGNRKLISDIHNTTASPYGWHDTDGVEGHEFTITRGNNIWAKEDTLASNSTTSGYSPNGGTDLTFDFPYNIDNNPRANLNASITNLFYMNNIMHDVMYQYGFDEESGNFQSKNYTGKGLQNDFVWGDAQDGSGTNNANFSTPVDGTKPRMQMFLWGNNLTATLKDQIQIDYPISIAKKYQGIISAFGPKLTNAPISGKLVLVNDGSSQPTLGCNTLVNADSLRGNIALIVRGTCGFTTKVQNAQNAGAIGVIVINNSGNTPTAMTGTSTTITIPSLAISQANGNSFIQTLTTDSILLSLYDSTITTVGNRTYDSDFDNGVIAHEYGHGISTRLTGGPGNSSCLTNQEQGGEGWSDFFALVLSAKPYETNLTGRGIGTHLIGQDTNGVGIRPYRYSRSMTINPVTYNNIKTLSVPHGVGFVWCSALYDILLDMIDKYGFDENIYTGTGGNNKTLELVIMGLKLQPCNPGFMDARNAIILADSLLNGGANKLLLWKAFARRGMGANASQGSNTSRSDGVDGFKLPTELSVSINETLSNQTIEVYPNPSKGVFTINASFDFGDFEYNLVDVTGKNVVINLIDKNENSASFNASNLKAGIYFITIKSVYGSVTKKLVIEN